MATQIFTGVTKMQWAHRETERGGGRAGKAAEISIHLLRLRVGEGGNRVTQLAAAAVAI